MTLPPSILDLRRRGYGSGEIKEHRAFHRIANRKRISWSAIALVVGLSAATFWLLPRIARFWRVMLEFIGTPLGFSNQFAARPRHVLPFVEVNVPYVAASAPLPTPAVWSMTAVITLAILIVSFFLPRNWTPIAYFLRALVLIQVLSLAYFAIFAPYFPYTLAGYTADMYTIGLSIIALVPLIYGLTYFVFDFGPLRKILIVVLAITHLVIFIPLQYLVHAALVRQFSLLTLPVLYMLFGALLDISVLIALYGWGMSWKDRSDRVTPVGRGARAEQTV